MVSNDLDNLYLKYEIQKNSKQWEKYEKLLEDIEERYNFIKISSKEREKKTEWIVNDNNSKILGNIKIIYLVPNNSEDKLLKQENNFQVIYFDDIIELIENKYNDKLSKEFCSILKELKK